MEVVSVPGSVAEICIMLVRGVVNNRAIFLFSQGLEQQAENMWTTGLLDYWTTILLDHWTTIVLDY